MRCPRHSVQGFLVCVSDFPLLFFVYWFCAPALLLVVCAGEMEGGDTCPAKRLRCRICAVCAEYRTVRSACLHQRWNCCCCLYSSLALRCNSYISLTFLLSPCRQKYEYVVLIVLLWFPVGFMRVLGRFFCSFVAPTFVAEIP